VEDADADPDALPLAEPDALELPDAEPLAEPDADPDALPLAEPDADPLAEPDTDALADPEPLELPEADWLAPSGDPDIIVDEDWLSLAEALVIGGMMSSSWPSWPLRAPIDTVCLSYFPDSSRWQITISCPLGSAEATCGTAVIAPTRNAADDVVSNAADPIRDARVLIV